MDKTSEEYKEFRRKANERNRRYYSKPEVKQKRKLYKKEYEKKNKEKIKEWRDEYNNRPEIKKRQRKGQEEKR